MSEFFQVNLELSKTNPSCHAFVTYPDQNWHKVGPWRISKLGTIAGMRLPAMPTPIPGKSAPEVVVWQDPLLKGWRVALDQEVGVNLYETELAAKVRAWQCIDQRLRMQARDEQAMVPKEEKAQDPAMKAQLDEWRKAQEELMADVARRMAENMGIFGDEKIKIDPKMSGLSDAVFPVEQSDAEPKEKAPKGKPLSIEDIQAAAAMAMGRGMADPRPIVGPKRASLLGLGDISGSEASPLPPEVKKWRKIFGKARQG